MTPQERAAALYATLSCVLYNEGHHDADQDIAVLAEAFQATRRAALLECLEETLKPEYYHAYNGVSALHEWLKDRLAQEG